MHALIESVRHAKTWNKQNLYLEKQISSHLILGIIRQAQTINYYS